MPSSPLPWERLGQRSKIARDIQWSNGDSHPEPPPVPSSSDPHVTGHLASLPSCTNVSLPTLLSRQALETLDNGKPYVISYLVDLDMVLKCLRYELLFFVLAIEKREGVTLGGRNLEGCRRLTGTGTSV